MSFWDGGGWDWREFGVGWDVFVDKKIINEDIWGSIIYLIIYIKDNHSENCLLTDLSI
jgi:hypothetical protein